MIQVAFDHVCYRSRWIDKEWNASTFKQYLHRLFWQFKDGLLKHCLSISGIPLTYVCKKIVNNLAMDEDKYKSCSLSFMNPSSITYDRMNSCSWMRLMGPVILLAALGAGKDNVVFKTLEFYRDLLNDSTLNTIINSSLALLKSDNIKGFAT